jgi:hypothetical protein
MSSSKTADKARKIQKPSNDSEYYPPYAEFAKNLRTWLIAYGIGAPALILSNKSAWDAVKGSGHVAFIGALFLLGVALQLIEALLYKHAMWHLYFSELDAEHEKSRWYRAASWLSESYLLELSFDVISVLFFIVATLLLFISLL